MNSKKSNGGMAVALLLMVCCGAALIGASCADEQPAGEISDVLTQGYTLRWQDEFNGNAIDSGKWNFDTDSTGNSIGWGNNECQHYTGAGDDNAYIEKGALVIEAKHEPARPIICPQIPNKPPIIYSSARLHTHGTRSFQYGVVAARIKMPSNNGVPDSGMWPAFWMLGENFNGWGHDSAYGGDTGWPASGEIDIMEMFGRPGNIANGPAGALHWFEPNCDTPKYKSYGTNHCSTSKNASLSSNVYTDYHIYGIRWTPSTISWFIDNVTYWSVDISGEQFAEFRQPHFILLNFAVGGNPVGVPNSANYPQKMYVDWVRYYGP